MYINFFGILFLLHESWIPWKIGLYFLERHRLHEMSWNILQVDVLPPNDESKILTY